MGEAWWQFATKLLDLLISPLYSGVLLASCLFVRFAPARFSGLSAFGTKHSLWLELAIVVLGFLFSAQLLHRFGPWFTQLIAKRTQRRREIKNLFDLSDAEKFHLRLCHENHTNTFDASLTDAGAQALLLKGVVYRAQEGSRIQLPHVIKPHVWAYINKHPTKVFGTEAFAELKRRTGRIDLPSVRA